MATAQPGRPAAAPEAPPVPSPQLEASIAGDLADLTIDGAWADALQRGLGDANPEGLPLYRRQLLQPLYEANHYHPIFAGRTGGLSERAEPLLRELRAAYQHALDTAPYHLDRLGELEARLQQPGQTGLVADWTPDPTELASLTLEAQAQPGDPEAAALEAAREAVGLSGSSPRAAIQTAYQTAVRALERSLGDEVAFELDAVHAFLSYAYDMADANTNNVSDDALRAAGGPVELQRERLRNDFRAADGATAEAFADQLDALVPRVPQYPLLMESLARYRDIVASGGWAHVSPTSMHVGTVDRRVGDLERRLAIEGYYTGNISNTYTQATADAVSSYQEAHQMDVTGAPHDMFWHSLNVPADERLQQIALTLQRWRETHIPNDADYYIYVDIPDFYAEVWRGGALQDRFRVVVGNNHRECNPETGTMDLANATPILAAQMEYLVFNPYWNVPDRILRNELELELYDDPTWLQEHGFEVVTDGGVARVRQLPGEDNALGAVKFVFPNIYNVYMHDTPLRRYFQLPIRDYSHGCVRVSDPMNFAQLLLTNDGHWDADRVAAIQAAATERTWHLDHPVPIYIEYYVVRVDDQGRTQFLSDIYGYDRERLGLAQPQRCTPPAPDPSAPQAGAVVWNPDGTAVIPDGTVIHPDGTVDLSPARLRAQAQGDGTTSDMGP